MRTCRHLLAVRHSPATLGTFLLVSVAGLCPAGAPAQEPLPTAVVIADLGQAILSHPMLYDLNGDGTSEIILTSVNATFTEGRVHALTLSGTPLPGWPRTLRQQPLNNTPAIGDIDGDGAPEIVVETFGDADGNNEWVHAFDARGRPKPGFPILLREGSGAFSNSSLPSPVLADLDGDGVLEIVAVSVGFPNDGSRVVALRGDGSLLFDRPLPPSSPPPTFEYLAGAIPMIGRLANGVSLNIIVSRWSRDVPSGAKQMRYFALNARGDLLPNWDIEVNTSTGYLSPLGVLGDINDDGYDELLVPFEHHAAQGGGAREIRSFDRDANDIPGYPVKLIGATTFDSSVFTPSLADVNDDGRLDVLTVISDQIDNFIVAYDGFGNKLLQHQAEGFPTFVQAAVAVAGTADGPLALFPLYALNNSTASLSTIPGEDHANQDQILIHALYMDGTSPAGFPIRLPQSCVFPHCRVGSVALTSDDASPFVQGIVADRSGRVFRFDTDISSTAHWWPMFQHDAQHTGRGSFPPRPQTPCVPSDTMLCLNHGRFAVTARWVDFRRTTGVGRVVPIDSPDSGLLWFFNRDNWEMLVKVLNGCRNNGHYWVFAAATTTVEYTLSVTDTQTGEVRDYRNPLVTLHAAGLSRCNFVVQGKFWARGAGVAAS